MIATWMVYALVTGALLGFAALAAEWEVLALRIRGFPTRALWAAALWVTILLPAVFSMRRPAAQVTLAPSAPITIMARGSALALSALSNATAGALASAAPTTAQSRRSLTGALLRTLAVLSTPALDRALVIGWIVGALGVLAYIACSAIALARRRRRWSRQLVRGTSVFVAQDFGPALVGLRRAHVVLPAWALSTDDASLNLMLRHELEHLRAHDTLLIGACGIAAALVPWNAALWWQFARLRLAAEVDCDARVLAQTGDARAYATVLVDTSERLSATNLLSRAFAGRRSLLERRILAISAARAPRRVIRALVATATAVVCVALACKAPQPQGISAASAAAPASFTRTAIAPQEYYPRVVRIDSVDDAATAWLRAALARYYPRTLTGDTTLAFISFYADADGRIVGAAARPRVDLGPDTADAPIPFDVGAYQFGQGAPARDSARVAAERATFHADLDTAFRSQVPTASVLGDRLVLPRQFSFDSLAGTSPYDPFLGADPHAFQRLDDIYLKPGMVGPGEVYVRVLTLLPGRGGPADFGHRVVVRTTSLTPPAPPAPQPDIEHLGDQPGGGWVVTDSLWRALTHKPVIIVDGAVRSFADMMQLAGTGTILDTKRVAPAAAMRLTTDSAAKNGAIVVTTKGHPPG